MHGVEPVWASEIEPFPIRVTKLRFPDMKHLGSVTDVRGDLVEPVDIITFGSPCQDLSVAGKQAGIHEGQRSNLFFEAIRIIREMRNATSDQFPRFAVWENVPGAFSSNKGQDFRAVLQAFAETGEKGAEVSVPFPEKGKWLPAGTVVGNGWSLAWRVYDAQFWGVPQRRKRIYLVADFGSERAGEILFKPEGVSGDPQKSGKEGEGTSEDAEGGAGGSNCAFAWANSGSAGLSAGENALTMKSTRNGEPGVVYPINTMVATRGGKDDMRTCFGVGEANDPQFTLSAAHEHAVCYVNGCDLYNGQLTGDKAATLGANSGASAGHDGPSVCYSIEGNVVDREEKQNGMGVSTNVSATLNVQDKHAVAYGISRSMLKGGEGSNGGMPYGNGVQPSMTANGAGAVCFQQNQREEVMDMGEKAGAITAEPGMHNTNYLVLNDQGGQMMDVSELAGCLRAQEHGHQPVVCYGIDCRNGCLDDEKTHTIQAKPGGGFILNCTPSVLFRNNGYANFTDDTGDQE